ncbi:MAG: DUF4956 domain-containing protein [Planctomycetota bacterium]|jgi:uncharacterized membrane protein YhiD involved in acid resistance|nr:DUF4956 domain-containing protein [Planctomycetota bacterium]
MTAVYTPESMLLSLLLAFVIGQVLAWVYLRIHSGLSYSRTFTQSLVLLTMVVALVMFVIGNSIVTAFGLIGALAIIRFRNVLKDTRDTAFVFFALVLGMAVGSQRHLAAVIGTVALCTVAFYLHYTRFGSLSPYDGHLNCRLSGEDRNDADKSLDKVLNAHCHNARRASVREAGGGAEYVYQVRLRDPNRSGELVAAMENISGVGEVGLVLRDEYAEI